MGADLSDPNWWPKPRREQKVIPWPTLIFGTLVPAVAGLGIVIAIVSHKGSSSPSAASTRSVAAFEICLKSHGVVLTQNGGAKQNAAVRACQDKLPPGTRIGGFGGRGGAGGVPTSAQQEFSQCVQSATAGLHGGRGRFGGGSSSAFRNAIAVCQGLAGAAGGGSSGGLTTPTATKPTAPPVA